MPADRRPGSSAAGAAGEFDAVIVGAGFAGLYMLHRLRGMGLSARIFEAAGGLGGTWCWNRYPGARCDVESMQYSYQFDEDLQQEWEWTERYATQPEILDHAEHVADRFDLCRDIRFNTRVMRERGLSQIEPTVEAEDRWVARNREIAEAHPRSTCRSWYGGANVPGKPRVFWPAALPAGVRPGGRQWLRGLHLELTDGIGSFYVRE